MAALAPAAARIDSSLNACDASAPAETEGNLVGDGGTGLEGSLCQPGLALAQRRALCTATQLLLLSQRRSRRRGISRVGGLGAGLTGGGEWEEEFGKAKGGLVVESETMGKSLI